jgi:8-amino-7-oxononanoate synthase
MTESGFSTPVSPPASLEEELARRLVELAADDLRRTDRPMRRQQGGKVQLDGRLLVDFSSNDYLGLAVDPRPASAGARALRDEGGGSGAARLISGTHPLHLTLERALADFKGKESALLFSTGYAANVGAIAALAGRGAILYSDELNHASLIDGCRMSRAALRIFPHRDLDTLEAMLDEDRGLPGERWIIVEGVYSMEGDLFPLDRLVPLARSKGARIYLDDAHGTGMVGARGRGTQEHFDVEQEIDVVMGTLGKALGGAGAWVAGPPSLRDWLLNRARTFVFSTAPPAALAAASLVALDLVASEPERRTRLLENARMLRDGLRERGFGAIPEGPGHITPILVGDPATTLRVARELEEKGFLVGSIRPPSVPPGTSRLRVAVSSSHTSEQLRGLLDALDSGIPSGARLKDKR